MFETFRNNCNFQNRSKMRKSTTNLESRLSLGHNITRNSALYFLHSWARICKCLRSPGIDSKESIPPAYVAWRAGTSNRVVVPARPCWESIPGLLIYQGVWELRPPESSWSSPQPPHRPSRPSHATLSPQTQNTIVMMLFYTYFANFVSD